MPPPAPPPPATLKMVLQELQKERAARAVLERTARLLHRRISRLEAQRETPADVVAVEQPLASMQREVERVTQHIERQLQRFEEQER